MARIRYVDPETIADPQIRQWLEEARKEGRPGPDNHAMRAHWPDVKRSFTIKDKMLVDDDADALMYDRASADDPLWQQLHGEFTEPELVELGYWIGCAPGGQRWLNALSTKQGEFEAHLAAKRSAA